MSFKYGDRVRYAENVEDFGTIVGVHDTSEYKYEVRWDDESVEDWYREAQLRPE